LTITLVTDDGPVSAVMPYDQADHVIAEKPCPCGSRSVSGLGKRIASFDTYEADARCNGCWAPRGVLRVKVSTLFGIEEDERVGHGPWRVY
jgi:hypothetical protein